MEEKQLEKLKEIYNKGKWNFIFFRGLLMFGLMLGVGMHLFKVFIQGREMDIVLIIMHYVSYTILGGLMFGFLMWKNIEKNYKTLIQEIN
jgi:hypothetical protein